HERRSRRIERAARRLPGRQRPQRLDSAAVDDAGHRGRYDEFTDHIEDAPNAGREHEIDGIDPDVAVEAVGIAAGKAILDAAQCYRHFERPGRGRIEEESE